MAMSRLTALWRGSGPAAAAAVNATSSSVSASRPPTTVPHVTSAPTDALETGQVLATGVSPILKPAVDSVTPPSAPSASFAADAAPEIEPWSPPRNAGKKNGKVSARPAAYAVDELGRRKNYPTHVPLNAGQNALLALGSGLWGVMNYATRPDLIATLSETTSSSFLSTLHEHMGMTPEGRQILRDRPVLSSKTVNLDYLRGLRRGTLGREYVAWLDRDGITPDSREAVRYIDSPSLAYTMLRYRQTHDLYHTLFCLPPTLVHELSLKVVEWANMRLPAAALSSTFGPLRLSAKRRRMWAQDWVPWALRQGEMGRTLNAVYWEKRWEQGIGELRRELGVERMNDPAVEARWRGYRVLREMERDLRRKGEWIDEPEEW